MSRTCGLDDQTEKLGTEAQLRWAEEVLPGLRARAGREDGDAISRSSRRRSRSGAR